MADEQRKPRAEAYDAILKQVAEQAQTATTAAALLDLAKAFSNVVHGGSTS